MRILITNDDGIAAPGLEALVRAAVKYGDVTVAAPKVEQSGKSHGIELHKPFEVKEVPYLSGVTAYSVDSTPADCIRFAILGLGEQYDLVLSGINNGMNLGADILYSGTVGAIFEAAVLGTRAIALSTAVGGLSAALPHFDALENYFRAHDLLSRHTLYNVNIPEAARGICLTRQGGPFYSDDFLREEGDLYRPIGKCVYLRGEDLSRDTDAAMSGYISITPMTAARTDEDALARLKSESPLSNTDYD